MKLNHLDLQVPNVPEVAEFLERHFDFEIRTNRTSPAIIVLSDREGMVLVLQRLKRELESYPEGFHIGFHVDDVAIVHHKHEEMLACGMKPSEVMSTNRGVAFYFMGPGNILIEVNCPKPRRVSPSEA
ncbi:VOC family protein [Pendulispora albinea]|uniref:VOC family protein n=1 Tax=Pendulispora albinea TaxID=2741071 RepID=A0ABZ2LTC9_9BACT